MKKQISISLIFYLFILSCSKGGGSEDTNQLIITTNEQQITIAAPGKAILNYPDNNKVCEEGTNVSETESSVNFGWSLSANTDSYDLKITNLDNQTEINQPGIDLNNKSVTLTKGTPYSWQITSKNQGVNSTSSDVWRFYLAGEGISNYAPFPATPITPSPGSTVDPVNTIVTISWESTDPDGDALQYTLYIDHIDGNQEPLEVHSNLLQTSIEVQVSSDTVYYWKVVTSDGSNTSTSIIYTFRTS